MTEKPWEQFPELSDLEIIIGNQKLKCHKIILAFRSTVFQRMFQSNMTENLENKLIIEDADENTILDFLWHLYLPTSKMNKSQMTTELFKVANKYLVTSLIQMFRDNSYRIINKDNAIDFAILASEIDSNDRFLMDVVEYILNHYSAIKEQPNYSQMISIPKLSGIMIETLIAYHPIYKNGARTIIDSSSTDSD